MGIITQSWGISDEYSEGEFTLLSQRFPVAHKNYKCTHCGRPIQVGSRYEYDAYLDGREFQTQRLHYQCAGKDESIDWSAINGDSWARANGQ